MAKSKITTEQCEKAFNSVKKFLGDDGSWHLNPSGEQYVVAKTEDNGKFSLIYKPLGPAAFIHCCEFTKALLVAQGGVEADDDEDDEDDESKNILDEEEGEDEDDKPKRAAK